MCMYMIGIHVHGFLKRFKSIILIGVSLWLSILIECICICDKLALNVKFPSQVDECVSVSGVLLRSCPWSLSESDLPSALLTFSGPCFHCWSFLWHCSWTFPSHLLSLDFCSPSAWFTSPAFVISTPASSALPSSPAPCWLLGWVSPLSGFLNPISSSFPKLSWISLNPLLVSPGFSKGLPALVVGTWYLTQCLNLGSWRTRTWSCSCDFEVLKTDLLRPLVSWLSLGDHISHLTTKEEKELRVRPIFVAGFWARASLDCVIPHSSLPAPYVPDQTRHWLVLRGGSWPEPALFLSEEDVNQFVGKSTQSNIIVQQLESWSEVFIFCSGAGIDPPSQWRWKNEIWDWRSVADLGCLCSGWLLS